MVQRRIQRAAFVLLLSLWCGSAWAEHLRLKIDPGLNTWVKEPGVRLDLDANDPSGTAGFHTPYVLQLDDGSFRMYYDAVGPGLVLSAHSTDGLDWTKEAGTRLAGGRAHPHVLQINPSQFRMYYEVGGNRIGSAISSDGLDWTIESDNLLTGVDPIVVERPEGGLRMYYRGVGTTSIFSATSVDGISWTVEPGARVSNAREFAAFTVPDDSVVLYYGLGTPAFSQILSARSADGLNFETEPGARLLPGGPGDLDSTQVLTTSIIQLDNGLVRMYYQGSNSGNINIPGRVFSAVIPEPSAGVLLGALMFIGWCKRSSDREHS